jgi:hypothetical protein
LPHFYRELVNATQAHTLFSLEASIYTDSHLVSSKYSLNTKKAKSTAMRSFAFLLASLTLLSGVIAVDIQKSVLITYPAETPDSIVDQAKKAIVEAGGVITHEYTLIK